MTSVLGQLSLEQALQANEAHVDDEWRTAALDCLWNVCEDSVEFTADDVWDWLRLHDVQTHEPRAMANVLLHGRREGWCVPTDRTAQCRRPSRNAGTVRIWRSLICEVTACPSAPSVIGATRSSRMNEATSSPAPATSPCHAIQTSRCAVMSATPA